MQAWTAARDTQTADELWLVEHDPVFTLGLAGRTEHVRETGAIAVVNVERGGQATYHGPGQAVVYVLLDLTRRQLTVRTLVTRLEQAAIDWLAQRGVDAQRRAAMPGVYLSAAYPDGLAQAKIAALGLKITRGRSFHGIALNLAMDLSPFECIDPCGYAGLRVTDLATALQAGPEPGSRAGVQALDFPLLARSFAETVASFLDFEP